MTVALDRLDLLLKDVDNLIDYHPGAGRPTRDAQPLLRSCVVLTYAAWEVFVEDTLVWAADEFSQRPSFSSVPDPMRQFVAHQVAADPWRLAGEGWRQVIVEAVTERVRGSESDASSWGLNTASPRQIARLHDELLGVRLLNKCSWKNKGNEALKADLALLVQVRGSIVHTGSSPGEVNLAGARSWRDFVRRAAGALDAQFEKFVSSPGSPK